MTNLDLNPKSKFCSNSGLIKLRNRSNRAVSNSIFPVKILLVFGAVSLQSYEKLNLRQPHQYLKPVFFQCSGHRISDIIEFISKAIISRFTLSPYVGHCEMRGLTEISVLSETTTEVLSEVAVVFEVEHRHESVNLTAKLTIFSFPCTGLKIA